MDKTLLSRGEIILVHNTRPRAEQMPRLASVFQKVSQFKSVSSPVCRVKLLKDRDKNDRDICPGKRKVPRNPALFTFSLLFPDSALNRYQNLLDVAMLNNTVPPSLSTS